MRVELLESPRRSMWFPVVVLVAMMGLLVVVWRLVVSLAPAEYQDYGLVSVKALVSRPQKYTYEHIKVAGTLVLGHKIMVNVEGNECVDGAVYYLKDGGAEIPVYVLGQRSLPTGRRTISGVWQKPPGEHRYRLEVE